MSSFLNSIRHAGYSTVARDDSDLTLSTPAPRLARRFTWSRLAFAAGIVIFLVLIFNPDPVLISQHSSAGEDSNAYPAYHSSSKPPSSTDAAQSSPESLTHSDPEWAVDLDNWTPSATSDNDQTPGVDPDWKAGLATPSFVIGAEDNLPTPIVAEPEKAQAGSSGGNEVAVTQDEHPHSSGETDTQRPIHLIVPVDKPNDHLCKLIFTAAANGYPKPVLVNWMLQPGPGRNSVSHLKKVSGVAAYLTQLLNQNPSAGDDLVLIVDAFDVWFQLPQKVLVSRYHRVLEADRARIAEAYGPGALHSGIVPKIVFAADKGCVGFRATDHWCWLQPESSLPIDYHGDLTDSNDGYSIRSSYRPRWLNSGVVIGPARDMLAMYLRAEQYLGANTASAQPESDQRILEMVFAQQQLHRKVESEKQPEWMEGAPPPQERISKNEIMAVTDDFSKHPEWKTFHLDPQMNYEFGINIDYNATISFTTSANGREFAYLYFNDSEPWPKMTMEDKHDCALALPKELPADIPDTLIPDYLREAVNFTSWKQVGLATHLCTGEIPTIIHHNGDKRARERHWPTLWFTRYWKNIISALEQRALVDPSVNTASAVSEKGDELTWEGICKHWEDYIFDKQFKEFAPFAGKPACGDDYTGKCDIESTVTAQKLDT